MKTFIIEYAMISPAVLATIVENTFDCFCDWHDVNEDFFEFVVLWISADKVAELEDFLSKYL